MSGRSILSQGYKKLAAEDGAFPKFHRMVRSSSPRGIGDALSGLSESERCCALMIRAEDGTGDTVTHAIVNSGRSYVMEEALTAITPNQAAEVLLVRNGIQQDSLSLLAACYETAKRIEDAAAEAAKAIIKAQNKMDPHGSYGLPRRAAHQARQPRPGFRSTTEGYLLMMAAIREKLEGKESLLENTLEIIRASGSPQYSIITRLIDASRLLTVRPIAGDRPGPAP